MKRALISICCLILAAVYPTAMVVEIIGIKIQRHSFKKAFRKSQLDLSKLETVFLSYSDYEGQKPGDEFKLGDNKYDVVSIKKTTQGFFITAFNDTLEKQLEIQLAENCKSSGNHPSKSKTSWLKLKLICQQINEFEFKTVQLKTEFAGFYEDIQDGYLSRAKQPPKSIS